MIKANDFYVPSPEFQSVMGILSDNDDYMHSTIEQEFMTLQLEITRLNRYIAALETRKELEENGVDRVPTEVITQTFKGEQDGE